MEYKKNDYFYVYATNWIEMFKKNEIRKTTYQKYEVNIKFIRENFPNLKNKQISRVTWQKVINKYAEKRTYQTVKDFHNQFKAMLRDLVHEGVIDKDPTHRIVVHSKNVHVGKDKFLSLHECKKLLEQLNLGVDTNGKIKHPNDWSMYIALKTGLRFSEVIALTPSDVDFKNNVINVDKTWNYKEKQGVFSKPKSKTSTRKVPIDPTASFMIKQLIKQTNALQGVPILHGGTTKVFNQTVNKQLKAKCQAAEIPVISFHGLRHTFASLCIANGVSLQQTSQWLGHSDTTITQQVYTHITDEMNEKDMTTKNKVMVML